MGVREIGAGLGILANPRSKEWMGSRVGGDLVDLALLGVALTRAEHPERTLMAAAAVLGVSAVDLMGTEQLARSRRAPDAELLEEPGLYIHKTITIGAPRAEVYAFWRDFSNLPRFMRHLHRVDVLDERRSRWVADGPPGKRVQWEAEVVEEEADRRIAWQSVGTSELYNAGSVEFSDARRDEGTVVTVEMRYAPPGGVLASAILKLFRKEPAQQVLDDLRRLKQVLETGDVVLSDATLVPRPRHAQPMALGDGAGRESEGIEYEEVV
jgi:uncharacterized membrane protein